MRLEKKIIQNNYTAGRQGNRIEYIIMHSYGGPGTSLYNWFNRPSTRASAHYAVLKNGSIEQYVYESNTAWHAGNWVANLRSIGIEHQDDGNHSDSIRTNELYTSSIHLVSGIFYSLGWHYSESHTRIRLHREFSNTLCPSGLDVERIRTGVKNLLSEIFSPNWKSTFFSFESEFVLPKNLYLFNLFDRSPVKFFKQGEKITIHYSNGIFGMTKFSYSRNIPNVFLIRDLLDVK